MQSIRHEEYAHLTHGLPFVLHVDLKRSASRASRQSNWHENLELQLCTEGRGTVLLNGESHPFAVGDIIAVNSGVLHFTGTDSHLTYSCLILGTELCKSVGVDPAATSFSPLVRSERLVALFAELVEAYRRPDDPFYRLRLQKIVLEMLLVLCTHHTLHVAPTVVEAREARTVKAAISYLKEHYQDAITLDKLSRAVLCDKYALCRAFKRMTAQTVIEYLNRYRCMQATECLRAGHTVTEAASLCGFENLSFFSKTFRRYVGTSPSEYRKRKKV